MKKVSLILLAVILITANTSFALSASAQSYDVSSALSVIKSKTEVKKCGVINLPIEFSEKDFDQIIGKAEYITISTLPEKSAGRLMLGGKELSAGQTITRTALGGMKFVPTENTASESSFVFKNAADSDEKYGVCTVFILENINLAPVPSDCSFDTTKNISYKGFFAAKDPEGDKVTYSIVSGGRHGTLKLLDKTNGFFIYTPKSDFTGRDIISFRAEDSFGNRSSATKVTVHVTEAESDTVFYDMTNHWAHASAIKAVSDGVLGARIADGKLVFCPDETVTRGDFLAVSMIAAGLEKDVSRTSKTSFADDASIPHNIKSYAETAYTLGFIKGYETQDGTVFGSNQPITRTEASCIISRILGVEGTAGNIKLSSVPAWAQDSVNTLSELGVMVGTSPGEPDTEGYITRAQAAKLYCNIKEYVTVKRDVLSNLFGLFK